MSITSQFQSTLPVWGGTQLFRHGMQVHRHFNPPSPCGEGQFSPRRRARTRSFQSTLPVWGGTLTCKHYTIHDSIFQSTLPVWGGTGMGGFVVDADLISIHPPRVGRDRWRCASWTPTRKFQSTLPVWGGTGHLKNFCPLRNISIHPPRVGRDLRRFAFRFPKSYFNPPSPCGEGRTPTA